MSFLKRACALSFDSARSPGVGTISEVSPTAPRFVSSRLVFDKSLVSDNTNHTQYTIRLISNLNLPA